jgi:hypothetical protein
MDSRDPEVANEESNGVVKRWSNGVAEAENKKNIVVAQVWSNYYKRLRSGPVGRR